MFSDEKNILMRVVERFAQTDETHDDGVKVILLPNDKTSCVEQSGEYSRSIMLDKYRSEGKVIWAGYSARSGTVYLSTATGS